MNIIFKYVCKNTYNQEVYNLTIFNKEDKNVKVTIRDEIKFYTTKNLEKIQSLISNKHLLLSENDIEIVTDPCDDVKNYFKFLDKNELEVLNLWLVEKEENISESARLLIDTLEKVKNVLLEDDINVKDVKLG